MKSTAAKRLSWRALFRSSARSHLSSPEPRECPIGALSYSILSVGCAWVFSMILTGYFLGNLLKSRFGIDLDEHIEWVVIIVVALSLIPPVVEYLKSRREKRAARTADAACVHQKRSTKRTRNNPNVTAFSCNFVDRLFSVS